MRCVIEDWYRGRLDFDLAAFFLLTAQEIGKKCLYYQTDITLPGQEKTDNRGEGVLPHDPEVRKDFIKQIVDKVNNKGLEMYNFGLILRANPYDPEHSTDPEFGYYDCSGCWLINLEEPDFRALQKIWVDNGFPSDAFFADSERIEVDLEKGGWTSYSPEMWKQKQL